MWGFSAAKPPKIPTHVSFLTFCMVPYLKGLKNCEAIFQSNNLSPGGGSQRMPPPGGVDAWGLSSPNPWDERSTHLVYSVLRRNV